MPLILKSYSWQQRDTGPHILLAVPFPANHLQQDDIFTTEQFVKISKAPHYWELFLCHPIDPDASRCSILEHEVIFELQKQDPSIHWDTAEADVPRSERATLKARCLDQHRARLEERAQQRAIEKDRRKKDEIHRQIERESNDRAAVERLLEDAKRAELKRMELAMVKDLRPTTVVVNQKTCQKPSAQPASVLVRQPMPPVRPTATLTVQFSERTFVTPKRESMEPAEQEWTRKQAAARKAVGFVDEDLRPDERNPEWLRQRGDTFFQQKNFLAAIAAYTAGIRLTKDYYALYLNRSAAHIALENYQRCAEDCSKALELLQPAVEANRKARVACLARRGAALVKLGFLRQGHEEMVAASQLAPDEPSLRREVELLQSRLDASGDSESD